ncbi:MAG: HipA N-terminal domain-containing protein [Bacteroidales bacterium]|nr:HipA N-terminal domain-containing protein [Bacteroidales bacterium]
MTSQVQELLRSEKKTYFKFQHEFIDRGIQISPFKMPLTEKILTTEIDYFEGLFGVFNVSFPIFQAIQN